jgi:hypothetical protein
MRALKVLRRELVLLTCKFLLPLSSPGLLGLARLPHTNGAQEGLEVVVEVVWVDAKIPIEEKEELLLHEVDLGDGKAKVLEAPNSTVPSPVLVLGRGVIEVLGGQNEGREEDPVDGAPHALGNRR